jgi:general secretion pathway protein K
MTRRNQRGVAIVLAMSIAALAAVAAAAIMVTQSTWARQNGLATDHAQARGLVEAGIDWARAVLSDDRRSSAIDHLGEPWALRMAPIPVERGEIVGYIEDEQSRFNLNNLIRGGKVNLDQLVRFRRLLSILGLPSALADAVADWIDEDSVPQPGGGAEDAYYLTLDPPYLAANRPLLDIAELALVRGFDEKIVETLRPFVTALPRYTPVNINTAPAEVIAAIADGMDLGTARTLAAQRDRVYFRTTADFSSRVSKASVVHMEEIAVSSDYFTVNVRSAIGDARAYGKALVVRENTWPVIVWRKYS